MSGFLADSTTTQKNYFRDLIGRLGDVLEETWSDTDVHHWSFGEGPPHVLGTDKAEQAKKVTEVRDFVRNPEFFNDKLTDILSVIRADGTTVNDGAKLKILITDLFQNRGDVGGLANELNDRYLRDGNNAVAVLGIRSAFNKAIDDLRGPGGTPLSASAADSFPFYLVVAGPVADVKHAVQTIKERFKVPDESSLTVMFARGAERRSRDMVARAADRKNPDTGFSRLQVVQRAPAGIPQLQLMRQRRVMLQLAPSEEPEASLPGRAVMSPLGRAFHPTRTRVTRTVSAYSAARPGGDDPAAKAATEAFTYHQDTGQLEIQSGRLVIGTVYLLQLDFMAEKGSFEEMALPWSLDDGTPIAEDMFKAKDGTRPGRTLNLAHFLDTLSQRLFREDVPLATYHLYVVVR